MVVRGCLVGRVGRGVGVRAAGSGLVVVDMAVVVVVVMAGAGIVEVGVVIRSEEHTSELQSL